MEKESPGERRSSWVALTSAPEHEKSRASVPGSSRFGLSSVRRYLVVPLTPDSVRRNRLSALFCASSNRRSKSLRAD